MAKKGLSVSAYAKRRGALGLVGASRQTVYDAVRDGRVVVFEDGSIDADASDVRWAAMSRTRADAPDLGADAKRVETARTAAAGDYNAERTGLVRAQRELTELKVAIERGEYVLAEEVERAVFEANMRTREAVLAVGEELAEKLAATSDPHEVRTLLDRAHRLALIAVTDEVPDDQVEASA